MNRIRWILIAAGFALVGAVLAVTLDQIGNLQAADDRSMSDRNDLRADLDAAAQLDAVQSALIDELQRRCRRATNCQPVNVPDVIDDFDPDDPEVDQPEIQESEIQDPEHQNPESQDPDDNDAEVQDSELQDGEVDDPDPDDPEIQDPEVDDPEPDDPPVCDGEFVCQSEIEAILADYASRSWVIDLLLALGCEISGIGSEVFTCAITGKP